LEGRLIYQGPALEIKDYFATNFNLICPKFANIPDYVMSKIHYEDIRNRERYENYFTAYEKIDAPKVQQMIDQK
jgi:hypothetical protein